MGNKNVKTIEKIDASKEKPKISSTAEGESSLISFPEFLFHPIIGEMDEGTVLPRDIECLRWCEECCASGFDVFISLAHRNVHRTGMDKVRMDFIGHHKRSVPFPFHKHESKLIFREDYA